MLILAGVSINAIVGDNGILARTQYASFLNEMAAVEEAVQLWKTGKVIESNGEDTKLIPANGLCKANELTNTERLVGEVGYYRIWSMSETQPTTDILSDASTFNSAFESELVFYPAGVQDLYYLNNDALEIKGNKPYLIDASTGMIYSMTGIGLKGVRCYSSSMAKAVMNGESTAPLFAEAEVSGTGSNEKLAGNNEPEFLLNPDGSYQLDADGNKIKNPDYNPNGFQIIADSSNKNIYKLYNNGELYAKGVKGTLLNSSKEEMDELDYTKWNIFEVPFEIPGYNTNNIQIIPGSNTMFIIDSNKELWAWGNNSYNKLGLTSEQQIDYTGREPTKLNINGQKVSKVFPLIKSTFVLTESNELYACGYNTNGELGIGNLETSQTQFCKVDFENPQNIKTITSADRDDYCTLILTNNNKIYFSGNTSQFSPPFKNSDLANTNVNKFIEILNNSYGTIPESKIVNVYSYYARDAYLFELENKKILKNDMTELRFNGESANISSMFMKSSIGLIIRENSLNEKELWIYKNTGSNETGLDIENGWTNVTTLVSDKFNIDDIKDIYVSDYNIFYLLNNGDVYASGANVGVGIGVETGTLSQITKLENLPKINNFLATNCNMNSTVGCFMLEGQDGKKYCTGNSEIIFRNKILQLSWKCIATNVKKFKAQTSNGALAYIDKNNDLWVLGNNSAMLGINDVEDKKIQNFVKVVDYLEGEIKNKISGKVEDYFFSESCLFIKTNEEDNNTVYVSGKTEVNIWCKYTYTGLLEDAYIPTEIKNNVKILSVRGLNRFILTYDNELYTWGHNDGSSLGNSGSRELVLNTNEDIDKTKISKIYASGYQSYLLLNSDNNKNVLWVTGCGIGHTTACNGLGGRFSSWNKFDMQQGFNNENIKDIVTSDYQQNYIVLTETGKLYGWGDSSKIGIGSTSNELNRIAIPLEKINNENLNFTQIAGGSGFFVALTDDGKVFGTGSNLYGILGRWVGIDRSSPNSRYKTAFEWVECPELEI